MPQALLDQYLSMTDPSRAQTVDTEIAKHCAYSLPGVALTLGRQNWHCLRETYETLASDMQVSVCGCAPQSPVGLLFMFQQILGITGSHVQKSSKVIPESLLLCGPSSTIWKLLHLTCPSS